MTSTETKYQRYKTVADFDRGFEVDSAMLADLRAAGDRDSIPFDSTQFARSRKLMADVVIALVARDVYADSGAYNMVINHRDPIFSEALRVINDDKRYCKLLAPAKKEE